jgi:hypothetical protein
MPPHLQIFLLFLALAFSDISAAEETPVQSSDHPLAVAAAHVIYPLWRLSKALEPTPIFPVAPARRDGRSKTDVMAEQAAKQDYSHQHIPGPTYAPTH